MVVDIAGQKKRYKVWDALTKEVKNTLMLSTCVNAYFAQQVSIDNGVKEYGEWAIAAMTKELVQMDKRSFKNKPVIEDINRWR